MCERASLTLALVVVVGLGGAGLVMDAATATDSVTPDDARLTLSAPTV